MAAAAILFVAEIVVPGFFFIWFGIGAVAAGIATLLGVGVAGQLGILIAVSGVLLVFSRRIAQKITRSQPVGVGADRLIHAHGIVSETIDPDRDTGMVTVQREQWRAVQETGGMVPKGTKIRVVRQEGAHLIVTPLQEESE